MAGFSSSPYASRLASIGQLGTDATAIAQAQAKNLMAQKQAAIQQRAQVALDASNQKAQAKQTDFKSSMDANTAALNQFAAQTSAQRTNASANAVTAKNNTGYTATTAPGDKRQAIINAAMSQLGVNYSWGGGGTKGASTGSGKGSKTVGFDCSGLVQYAYSKVGIALPRTAATQGTQGVKTSIDKLQPGDLVAWNSGKHIAVYAGNGNIIEAPHTGAQVRTRTLSKKELGAVHGVALGL